MKFEFIAMTEAVRELLWFHRIMDKYNSKKIISDRKLKSLLLVYNQSTIDFVKSPTENHRTKHIDINLPLLKIWFIKIFLKLNM